MSNHPSWPLEPIYASLSERDWYRKNIQKLLDLNFGKIWRYYLRLRYVNKHMHHRVNITEIRAEEKTDLTAYKIKGINIMRRAYYAHSVELIKFFYNNGSNVELTKIEIENNRFRYKRKDGSFRITDTLEDGTPAPENETEKSTDAHNSNIDLKEVVTFKSKSDSFDQTVDSTIKSLAKDVVIKKGI